MIMRDYICLNEYEYDYDRDYGDNDLRGVINRSSSEFNENMLKLDQSDGPPGHWCCLVCKYDNPAVLFVCEICGVSRNASLGVSQAALVERTDNDTCKESQTSLLAKSLFTRKSLQKLKNTSIFQQINTELLSQAAHGSQGMVRAKFHDIQKCFTIPDSKSRTISIEPFKFDTPSPDDVVSAGKRASGKFATAKFNSTSATSKASEYFAPEAKVKAEKTKSIAQQSKPLISRDLYNANEDVKHKQQGNRLLAQQEFPSERTPEGLHNLIQSTVNYEQKNSNLRKVFPLKEYKPESWMFTELKEPSKNLLHLAVVGHVDAGKSTLMGRLLHLMGCVSQKEMHKYEREAKQKGKQSFAYAWVLDEGAEERNRGLTMTVAVAHFESPKFHVILLDSPGHKDFIPNMISGTSQADAAVLVVDASMGAFEAGMHGQGEGQTKEHALLIRSFGVEQLIIAVNKMDAVDNCEERFNFIKSQLGSFLRRCGFKESGMIWIPLSAMENQNLTEAASDSHLKSWYSGPYLLEAIDLLRPPKRDILRPLRLPISEVTKSHSLGQVAISGKLEGGAVKVGIRVLVMPVGVVATIKAIEQGGEVCAVARAGDDVDIGLQGIDHSHLTIGGVLCHTDYPVPIATRMELKVLSLDLTMPILVGSQVELHVHHANEAARVVQLLSILDPKTGQVLKKSPRCLTANQSALIEVVPNQGVCIEEYSNYKALGRVILRAAGKTIAVGIVKQIIEQQ